MFLAPMLVSFNNGPSVEAALSLILFNFSSLTSPQSMVLCVQQSHVRIVTMEYQLFDPQHDAVVTLAI